MSVYTAHDPEAARRAVFLAREADAAADRAYDRWCETERDAHTADEETARDLSGPCPVNRLIAYFGPGYAQHYTQPEEAAAISAADLAFQFGEGAVEQYDGLKPHAEISAADRAAAFSAEGVFLALCKSKTGESLSDETLGERRTAADLLLSQTHTLAARMETAFAEIYAEDCETARLVAASVGADLAAAVASVSRGRVYRDTPFALWRYYIHSGHLEKIPSFSRMMFLPYVAQHVRGPILSALEFWLERNPFARFWTFTTGTRVKLSGVRARTDWLHRRLSKLNAEPFMREAGVQIVFRSTELGTPETFGKGHDKNGRRVVVGSELERDESGEMTFHVHAHCVVEMSKGQITGPSGQTDENGKPLSKWSVFLRRVHDFWGYTWQDGDEHGGPIRDAREVCKYVTKPGEMLKLTGRELVALAEQLKRAKLVQPMGSLAAEIKARREAPEPLRLVRQRTKDGSVYRVVKNWNHHANRTREEKAADAAAKLERRSAPTSARVLSRLLPGFGPAGVSEPRVVVMAQNWQEQHVRALPQVASLIRATAHEFWAGSAIRVHTCTPTVRETAPFDFVRHLPPPRHLPTGAELAGLSR